MIDGPDDEGQGMDLFEALDMLASSPQSLRLGSLLPGKQQVPPIVTQAIQHLITHGKEQVIEEITNTLLLLISSGLRTEGIFRVPGAKARIDEVGAWFNHSSPGGDEY